MPQDEDPLANLTEKEISTILESLRPKALFELCSVYDPEPLPESIHTFLQEASASQCQELLLRTLHRVYVVERKRREKGGQKPLRRQLTVKGAEGRVMAF